MNKLGIYITQVRGISYKPEDISDTRLEGFVPVLKANNITENGIQTNDLIYIHRSKVNPEQFIRKGDILIAASSGSKEIVGKHIYFDNNFEGSFGAFCKVVRPNSGIYPEFVSTFFKTPAYRRHIRSVIRGANINNLRNEHIDNLLIPNLAFHDQIKIANILGKAENLIKQRKESLALLDEFLKSTFFKMFGDPVRNEKGWEKDLIGNKCKVTKLAGYEYTKHIKYADEGEIIVVKGLNVKNGRIKLDNVSFIDKATSDYLIRSKLFKGDVVMTYIGINIGDVAIIEEDGKFHLAPNVSKITPKDFNEVNSFYLMHYLRYNKRLFLKGTTDTAKPALNMSEIRKIELVIPKIEIQEKFENICQLIEKLKTQSKQSLTELQDLYGGLSQKAFKGELNLSKVKVEGKFRFKAEKGTVKVMLQKTKLVNPMSLDKIKVFPLNLKDLKLAKESKAYGDPFEGVELPKGQLPSMKDLPPGWEIVTRKHIKELEKESPQSEWLQTRFYKRTRPIAFTPVEGRAVFKELFASQSTGFSFQEFREALDREKFNYNYKEVSEFIMQLIIEKQIEQYYFSKAWRDKGLLQPTAYHDDFLGDGSIWFVPKTRENKK